MKTYYSFIILLVFALASCKEEVDTDRPTITIDQPASGDVVYTADSLKIVATLSDNAGLLQYKLILDGRDELNDIGSDSTMSLTYIEGTPDVTDYELHLTVPLPESTYNGYFRAIMSCLDAEGNESLRDTVDFRIRNSIDSITPVFNVTAPNDTLGFGSGFLLSGTVTDSQDLVYAEVFIGPTDFSDTIRFTYFPWISNNTVDFDHYGWWHQVDSSWAQGDYHIYVTAWDNHSGVSHSIPFHVSY